MSQTDSTFRLADDDFNIVKENWIGKVIINHGLGGDEKMSYGDAVRLKERILRNEKLRQDIIELRDNPHPIPAEMVIERLIGFTEDLTA